MKLICPIISMCALAVTTQASFDLARSRPPVATPQPKNVTVHADPRVDNYFWLREKENPAVINYLERENAYTMIFPRRYLGSATVTIPERKKTNSTLFTAVDSAVELPRKRFCSI